MPAVTTELLEGRVGTALDKVFGVHPAYRAEFKADDLLGTSSQADAHVVADKVLLAASTPLDLGQSRLQPGASIDIATDFPGGRLACTDRSRRRDSSEGQARR